MLKMGFLTLVQTLVNVTTKSGQKEKEKESNECIILKNSIRGESQESHPVVHKSVCCFHYCAIMNLRFICLDEVASKAP